MYEAQGIVCGISAQLFGIAKDVVPKGMSFEEDILKLVVDQFGGRVVVTLDFITDHLHLLVDFRLWILTVENDVCQHVHSLWKVFFRDGSIETGVLLVGEGVQFTTQSFDGIDDLKGITARCALEGHVFTEMSQSFFANTRAVTYPSPFVSGARSDVIATIHHLRSRRQVDEAQAVFENICIVFCHFGCKGTKNS